ncbi:MAG: M15 family metallopeptidase [Rhodobacteraceae bacterium]|nr:M15 family metallopeptidase [Paracoccaceae bacterium]
MPQRISTALGFSLSMAKIFKRCPMKLANILLAVAIILAPAGWYLAYFLFFSINSYPTREEFVSQQEKLTALTIDFNSLQQQITAQGQRAADAQTTTYSDNTEETNGLVDIYTQVVNIANRREVNAGLTNSSSSYLVGVFGPPRQDLTQDCQAMTNPILKDLVVTRDVGPIRVTMLEPAIISLQQIFKNVQVFEPELYDRISTAGSLCVRLIRGSETSISTHAYGLSVDLNIDGQLDNLGDGKTQLGLTILAEFFKREGWYWGAGFSREDSMHFQVSREKIETWRRLGQIPSGN